MFAKRPRLLEIVEFAMNGDPKNPPPDRLEWFLEIVELRMR
jgi:hypothetical protein